MARVSFPGRTPSLKSSLPCLAFPHDSFHSCIIVLRMVVFVVAVRVRSTSNPVRVPGSVEGFRLLRAASLAAWSAASLPDTPTCAGIHLNYISVPWLRSSSRVWMTSMRIYCPEGHLGLCMACNAAWLSVNMVYLFGPVPVDSMSSASCSASLSPMSSAAYTVDVSDVPIYWVRFNAFTLYQ
jgi:hypothetical protein